MKTLVRFQCPHCHVGLKAKREKAGNSYGCPSCETPVTVPTQTALVPVTRTVIVPEIIHETRRQRKMVRRRKRRREESKPVEMRLGEVVGMKVDVDKKTRNALATTFLGGLLVALGAVIFSMFGGKSKSA